MRKTFKFKTTLLAKAFVQAAFLVCKWVLPIKENKVTFASYRAERLTGNLLFVYNEVAKNPEYECHFLFKRYRTTLLGKFDYFLHMIKASYHLATSKFFFVDDFYFPIYVIKPRKDTDIIQLWHAAGAFKKFGYSTINKDFGPSTNYLKMIKIHSNYSYAIVSSLEVIPFYAEAFNMDPKRVLPLGVPRTDYFFKTDTHVKLKEKFYNKFPDLKDKRLILFAPTFRGKSHNQNHYECPLDFSKLYKTLGDDYILLVHLHPYIQGELKLDEEIKGFVYNIKEEFTIEELLVLANLLITDFSSIVFDFSLMEKPVAFFATDLEDYLKERGFYYDYLEFIPGPFFQNSEEIARWIVEGHYDRAKIKAFKNKFFDFVDGHSSERVVRRILGKK